MKHMEEQIIAILKEHKAGMKTARLFSGVMFCAAALWLIASFRRIDQRARQGFG
jgi:hypothetical protein